MLPPKVLVMKLPEGLKMHAVKCSSGGYFKTRPQKFPIKIRKFCNTGFRVRVRRTGLNAEYVLAPRQPSLSFMLQLKLKYLQLHIWIVYPFLFLIKNIYQNCIG